MRKYLQIQRGLEQKMERQEQTNALDDIYAHYQDSDDADSPITSETDDNDGDDKQRKKKNKRTIRYS